MLLFSTEDQLSRRHGRRWLALFAIINSFVMTGITLSHVQWPEALSSQAYLLVGMVLHFGLLSLVVALIAIALASVIRLQKYYAALAIFLFTLMQLLIITNVKVFSLYHFHLNGMVLNLVLGGALLENLAFSWVMWLAIGAILLGVIFTQGLLVALSKKLAESHRFTNRHYVGLFLGSYIALQLFSGSADAFGWNHITYQNRYIPWMPTTTMRSSLEKMGFDVKEKPTGKAMLAAADGLNYPKAPLHCAPEQRFNILMLVVDSLRFDQLNAQVMPNTTALLNQSMNFSNHYSSGSATRYGIFTLFYGLPGNYWKPMLAVERGSALFDVTQAQNYRHFLYGSSKLTFPEFNRTVFSALRSELQRGNYKNSAANDHDITERFIADLNELPAEQPFFGFLFFDSPHGFSLPDNYPHRFEPMLDVVNYLELSNDYNPEPFLNLYKTTIHYVDGLIQQILDQLQQQQRLQNTIVIITGDHGQEFNETGKNFWGHNGNFSQWQTKVPMVVLWPGRSAAQVETLTSHEDLVPSLLKDAFNCSNPTSDYSTGNSLLALVDNPPQQPQTRSVLMETWTERAIMYDNHLYLINPVGYINAVDQNYNPQDQLSIPPHVLAENIEKMSAFLKKQ